jgi:cytochrome c peroxidase
MKILLKAALTLAMLAGVSAYAATPVEIQQSYTAQAKQENPQFKDFSASRGEQFYHAKRTHSSGNAISCASCHTDNPKNTGTHERTRKTIQPLAPIANTERFSDPAKVEKWFKRNCQDVLERACTAQEKGDYIAYLRSVK